VYSCEGTLRSPLRMALRPAEFRSRMRMYNLPSSRSSCAVSVAVWLFDVHGAGRDLQARAQGLDLGQARVGLGIRRQAPLGLDQEVLQCANAQPELTKLNRLAANDVEAAAVQPRIPAPPTARTAQKAERACRNVAGDSNEKWVPRAAATTARADLREPLIRRYGARMSPPATPIATAAKPHPARSQPSRWLNQRPRTAITRRSTSR
jgi:hypothetical protein